MPNDANHDVLFDTPDGQEPKSNRQGICFGMCFGS